MTSGPIAPGTVLAGRYRLDDLLTEHDGARFWRATDTVLARNVAVHAVPSDDERAAALLEGARVSATVSDPHLLRVLDCDDSDGITWVVNEWGDGLSLDLMLQQGTLPPSRAAWLTREVAEAIAAGHAQGIPHGRLNPEAVLVTNAGAVKIIGYVVDAALERPRPPDALYGQITEREADVVNLAGILYAALTGRWPGVARSSVPPAPREARRPLRPRQVRAGVPRPLDAICERVLHREASRHEIPIETAHEVAAALADYVGETSLAPLDPAAMTSEPTQAIRHQDLLAGASAEDTGSTRSTGPASPAPSPAPDDEATRAASLTALTEHDTQLYAEPLEAPGSLKPLRTPEPEETPHPPPFEDSPERPLFATTERRVPAGAPATPYRSDDTGTGPGLRTGTGTGPVPSAGGAGAMSDTGTGTGTGSFWPFVDEEEEKAEQHTGKEGRGWLRTAVLVGVLLLVVVAMIVAFNIGRQGGGLVPSGEDSPSASPSQAAASQVLPVRAAKDFDPEGDPPEENPEEAGAAVDGDPATGWSTLTYRGNPALGGLKSGVGLLLDLGEDRTVGSVGVRFAQAGTDVAVYAAPEGVTEWPASLDQLDEVAARKGAGARANLALEQKPTTRYLLLWLTRLPAADGGFKGEITGVTVRS